MTALELFGAASTEMATTSLFQARLRESSRTLSDWPEGVSRNRSGPDHSFEITQVFKMRFFQFFWTRIFKVVIVQTSASPKKIKAKKKTTSLSNFSPTHLASIGHHAHANQRGQ